MSASPLPNRPSVRAACVGLTVVAALTAGVGAACTDAAAPIAAAGVVGGTYVLASIDGRAVPATADTSTVVGIANTGVAIVAESLAFVAGGVLRHAEVDSAIGSSGSYFETDQGSTWSFDPSTAAVKVLHVYDEHNGAGYFATYRLSAHADTLTGNMGPPWDAYASNGVFVYTRVR